MNIVLIGYRCSGKTSVGQALARILGWPLVDTDDLLVERAGRSVDEIVQGEGWEGFRRLESEVVREACSREGSIIATGGGAVMDPANVAAMQASGCVVWLRAAPATVRQRMAADGRTEALRPALTGKGLYEEIGGVMAARDPLYRRAMNLAVDTENRTIDELAGLILERFSSGIHQKNEDGKKTRKMGEQRICRAVSDSY